MFSKNLDQWIILAKWMFIFSYFIFVSLLYGLSSPFWRDIFRVAVYTNSTLEARDFFWQFYADGRAWDFTWALQWQEPQKPLCWCSGAFRAKSMFTGFQGYTRRCLENHVMLGIELTTAQLYSVCYNPYTSYRLYLSNFSRVLEDDILLYWEN